MSSVLGEERLGLIVADTSMNDNIITLLPIDRCSNSVLVAELDGIEDTDDLVKVTASDSRVVGLESDDLLRVDDEDCSDLWVLQSSIHCQRWLEK